MMARHARSPDGEPARNLQQPRERRVYQSRLLHDFDEFVLRVPKDCWAILRI